MSNPHESVAAGEQAQHRADFKFVFWQHTPELAKEAGEAVRDCDVVAIEFSGLDNPEVREFWEEAFTEYIAPDAEADERAEFESELQQSDEGKALQALMQPLIDSDAKVRFIDLTASDLQYQYVAAAEDNRALLEMAAEELVPNREMAEQLDGTIEAETTEQFNRTERMTEQLEGIAEEYPGATIGVILSPANTAVYHNIVRTHNYGAHRKFVVDQAHQVPGHPMVFGHYDEEVRSWMSRNPDRTRAKTLASDHMARIVLAHALERHGSEGAQTRAEIDALPMNEVWAQLRQYEAEKAEERQARGF